VAVFESIFTKKPNWRKGTRATSVRAWSPSKEIYSKSTICDFLLTVIVTRAVCQILSRIET